VKIDLQILLIVNCIRSQFVHLTKGKNGLTTDEKWTRESEYVLQWLEQFKAKFKLCALDFNCK
jgi:hypothetical protein